MSGNRRDIFRHSSNLFANPQRLLLHAEYLYLNNNDFTGGLPHEMFKDKALGTFGRNLRGPVALIPSLAILFEHSLTHPVALAVDVRLEYNALSGPLPEDVHKLHALGRSISHENRLYWNKNCLTFTFVSSFQLL